MTKSQFLVLLTMTVHDFLPNSIDFNNIILFLISRHMQPYRTIPGNDSEPNFSETLDEENKENDYAAQEA